jgi:hypothetical protein
MLAAASLVLNALVDENGLPAQDLPTPDELMKSHSYATITEAMTTVQRHSYGTLEEAKKKLTSSRWLSLVYAIADHFKEPDPRKIASLPADIILHWQAWFALTGNVADPSQSEPPALIPAPIIDQQCADVMRILNE